MCKFTEDYLASHSSKRFDGFGRCQNRWKFLKLDDLHFPSRPACNNQTQCELGFFEAKWSAEGSRNLADQFDFGLFEVLYE
jgi:hypothetical protein